MEAKVGFELTFRGNKLPAMAETAEEAPVTGLELEPAEVARLVESGEAEVIDVRRAYEHEAGHISGARHIEMNDLTQAANSVPKDRPVVFYCRGGSRSAMAAEAFSQAGFDAHNMTGGLLAWADQGLPLEPEGAEVAAPRPV
jgi:rhodanese-related sulfurtransferase